MKIVYKVFVIVFALMFLNGGLNKIFNYIPIPEDMPQSMVDLNLHLEAIGWLMPLIAIAEIVDAILVLIPKTRALGALVLFPILVGILLTHLTAAPSGLPIAIAFCIVEIWILLKNKDKFLPLIG